MKAKLILGAILALLLAVASVSLAAASGDPTGDHNGDKVRVLHVTLQHHGQDADLDLGAPVPASATGSSSPATWCATAGGSAWVAATA